MVYGLVRKISVCAEGEVTVAGSAKGKRSEYWMRKEEMNRFL